MSDHVILFGWNRSIPGREKISAQHFQEFVNYLTGLQKGGAIDAFEIVFLNAHGGDLNGFFLLKGDGAKLSSLVQTTEWTTHMTRAAMHLDRAGAVHGITGDEVAKRMTIWQSSIPS